MSHRIIKMIFVLSAILNGLTAYCGGLMFETLDSSDGLSDNDVRFINSLPDGRLVFTTEQALNIYDGVRFKKYYLDQSAKYELDDYSGHYHLYLSSDTMLWVKNYHKFFIFDLRRERFISPGEYLRGKGVEKQVDDLFVDLAGNLWLSIDNRFYMPGSNLTLTLPGGCGEVQDLESDGDSHYLFDNKGTVHCYDSSGEYKYSRHAYASDEVPRFANTSLVVEHDGVFYQLRNGTHGVFQKFDTAMGVWEKILERDYSLNTLMITDDGDAYIACRLGFWIVNTADGAVEYLPYLRTRRGNVVATEISTVFQDAQGTLWVGTLNRGLLYCNPERYRMSEIYGVSGLSRQGGKGIRTGLFSEDRSGNVYVMGADGIRKLKFHESGRCSAEILPSEPSLTDLMGEYGSDATFLASDGSVYVDDGENGCVVFKADPEFRLAHSYAPLFSELYLYGEKVLPGKLYGGRLLMPDSEPYIKSLVLGYDQNFITLKFSPLNLLHTSGLGYSYKLEGFDRDWVDVDYAGSTETDISAQYTNLPPGKYVFKIKTYRSDDGSEVSPVTELDIEILTPWYLTWVAWVCYVLIAIVLGWMISWLYIRSQRKAMERKHREEILLVRIKGLIEQCDRYEAELKIQDEDVKSCEPADENSLEENAFVAKAVKLVEDNMNTPGYSVEQLSRDLCMERTGLYKKLVTLLNQSPSLFMRNIRLKHAAELLAAKEGSVAEIAMRTGFSNASYFSKCFQEVYGCRPSEFTGKK